MKDVIGSVTGRVADFTIGTAIVVVHVWLAERGRRRVAPQPRHRPRMLGMSA